MEHRTAGDNERRHHENTAFSQRLCAILCGCTGIFSLICAIYRLVYAAQCRSAVLALDLNTLDSRYAAEYLRLISGAKHSASAALLLSAIGCVAACVGYLSACGILNIPENIGGYCLSAFYVLMFAAALVEARGRVTVILCALCFLTSAVAFLPIDLSMGGQISFGLGSRVELSLNSRFRLILGACAATVPVAFAAIVTFFNDGGALMFFALIALLACACCSGWCRLYECLPPQGSDAQKYDVQADT